MNEIILNVKSQLIYVLENQLKIKPEFFLKEFGTPDSDDVLEKYQVTPKEFIDVKALMGDTSDNIPEQ